jgi:hypothetical protein
MRMLAVLILSAFAIGADVTPAPAQFLDPPGSFPDECFHQCMRRGNCTQFSSCETRRRTACKQECKKQHKR